MAPVEKLSKISGVFLAVTLSLGAAVLILVSILSMRERKYEVGVLRAMGMKRSKVILGMLTETLAITAACLLIGLGTATAAAPPVADILMRQTTQSEPVSSGQGDRAAAVQIRMTASTAGEIGLVALLLAGISSAAGILYITRFEPSRYCPNVQAMKEDRDEKIALAMLSAAMLFFAACTDSTGGASLGKETGSQMPTSRWTRSIISTI
ncbi:MAG: FtsX-like permease family protein [Oscillospiraceae bacterium]